MVIPRKNLFDSIYINSKDNLNVMKYIVIYKHILMIFISFFLYIIDITTFKLTTNFSPEKDPSLIHINLNLELEKGLLDIISYPDQKKNRCYKSNIEITNDNNKICIFLKSIQKALVMIDHL